MATSSITKNFVISGQKQVETFINAIEESVRNRPIRIPVAANYVEDDTELMELMEKWKTSRIQ